MSSSEKVSDQKIPGPTWTDAEPYFKITPEDIRPPATPEEIAEAEADLPRRPFQVIQGSPIYVSGGVRPFYPGSVTGGWYE